MQTPAMSRHLLLLLGFSLATIHAADSLPEDLLRQGLFEEEANQNLDKAAEHYRAVIAAHDHQRALAASATFRLGEIARKKNDKETAAAAFRTVTERFPEQQELARLSRENLAALGIETTAPATPAAADPEDAEIARLKELARNSPDLIDGADSDGFRPIHHAAAKGWTRVISYLLENKADPNGLTIKERFTPLHLATVHGHLSAVKALLAAKADPNVTLGFSKSAMDRLPAMDGRLEHAKGSWTALDLAIVYDRRETALTLIDAGTDIKRVGPVVSEQITGYTDGFNTLMLAIYLKRNHLAQVLIDAGSPLNAVGKKESITPLGVALGENKSMVAPLLKAGADPNLTLYEQRFSPLYFADSIEIAKMLVDAGASVKAASREGWSPLHGVQYRTQSVEMAEFLISKGADPNAKDSSGLTPLDHVATGDKSASNVALVDTLLKHGATVPDPRALLRRTSEAMLPFVGERLVYPKLLNPDAILLSVSGNHSFNQEPAPPPGVPGRRVFDGSRASRPEVIAVETRASPASPPPSLAEVMRMAFGQSGYPQSIRILRRGESDRLEIIRAWAIIGGESLPTDWPALVWGDIVEVRNSSGGTNRSPTVGDFAAMIPARAVTYRLSELEFPKTIPGEETFWLDSNTSQTLPSRLYPKIQSLADLTRFVVHRKGLPEPVTLDFSKPTDVRLRLLDGDTVEMSWDLPKLYQSFSNESAVNMISLAGQGGSGGFGSQNPLDILTSIPVTPPVDFSKICILRRAENWKSEMVDFKALLDQLPPEEKWERDALIASMPKLNPGDAVILIENQAAHADKTAAEFRKKAGEVSWAMRPPPMPSHRQGPTSGRSTGMKGE